jgi:hypothetical protein
MSISIKWIILSMAIALPEQQIIITEVMSNPVRENTGEFIELLNTSESVVDLRGWAITDGDSDDTIVPFEGGNTTLKPGQFAVILDSEYAGDYTIPEEALRFKTDDKALGNGLATNDTVTLVDGQGRHIDSFSQPFDPGNGVSAERISLATQEWRPSTDPSGSSPGSPNNFWVSEEQTGEPPQEGPLDIIINELMPTPDTRAGHPEWIEIHNRSTETVSISGYIITDSTGRGGRIAHGVFIRPLSHLVLTRDPNGFASWFADVDVIGVKLPILNNSGDTIALTSPNGQMVEKVSYREWRNRDRSIERIDPREAGDQLSNWRGSIHENRSTPGMRNSVTTPVGIVPVSLWVMPKSFDPRLVSLKIIYEVPIGSVVTVLIFDSNRRQVRTLFDRMLSGGRQEIEWDGKNNGAVIVPVGSYICQLIVEQKEETRAATSLGKVNVTGK